MKLSEPTRSIEAIPLCLRDAQPFGVGGRRLCFVHPLEPGKCVKILRQDEQRTVRLKAPTFVQSLFRRHYDNNAHEHVVLNRLFRRIGPAAANFLPRCYGWMDTDLGRGLVVDLIRDQAGGIARSLRELISSGVSPSVFRSAFDELGDFMIRHRVLTRALLDHNIAAQERGDGTWRLYIIDGLGDPAWLPVAEWLPLVGRAKIKRRIAEAWPRMEQLAKAPVTPELIQQSTWGQGFLKHRG